MRYCDAEGRLDFVNSGPLGSQPNNLFPWFDAPKRKNIDMRIIFGHWSSLGYYEGPNCYGIDTGCLWGGQLTALRLDETMRRFSVDCHEAYKQRKTGCTFTVPDLKLKNVDDKNKVALA